MSKRIENMSNSIENMSKRIEITINKHFGKDRIFFSQKIQTQNYL